ncbi:MAG: hypothetical protein DRO98_04780 [Archaeoglobales archaeon]|nr:MAG: hypothetical protein DRO98_04780 [Archaeoglobales archaeon]
MINDMGVPKLQIKFSATKSVELTLTDPDGVKTDWSYVELGVTGAKLRMSDYGRTPPPGTYTLFIKDALGREVAPPLTYLIGLLFGLIVLISKKWSFGLSLASGILMIVGVAGGASGAVVGQMVGELARRKFIALPGIGFAFLCQ